MKKETLLVRKLFARFLIPALLSSIALAIGAVVDSFYIGRAVGEGGLFIIGSAYPVYLIFSTLSIGMATGGAVHFSETSGEGKKDQARKIFFNTVFFDMMGILLLVALGFIFKNPLISLLGGKEAVGNSEFQNYVTLMLLSSPLLFMQAPLQRFVYVDGSPRLASLALVLGNLFDCLLGYVFIVVLKTGVNGSVYSNIVGAVIMEAICLVHFFKKKGTLRFTVAKPQFKIAARSFFTGFATEAIYLYQFVTVLVFNRILLNIGGEWAVAVYEVVFNAGSVPYAIIDAVALAMTALLTTFYGEKNKEGMKSTFKFALIMGVLLSAVTSGVMMIFAPQYCGLFGIETENLRSAAYAFRWFVSANIVAAVNALAATYFQSMGKEKYCYTATLLRSFAILLPVGAILSLFGYEIFWICFLVTEILSLLCIVPMLFHAKLRLGENCKIFSKAFVGSGETISVLCEELQTFLEDSGLPMKQSYFVALSADETLRLIAEADKSEQDLFLQVTLIVEGEACTLHIRDNAKRFNPFELSEEEEFGLKIIKSKSKDFSYRQYVGFNTLTVIF